MPKTKPPTDPVVAELRAIRKELAAMRQVMNELPSTISGAIKWNMPRPHNIEIRHVPYVEPGGYGGGGGTLTPGGGGGSGVSTDTSVVSTADAMKDASYLL